MPVGGACPRPGTCETLGVCRDMQIVHQSPTVGATSGPLGELDADLLALPYFQDDDLADVPTLDAASAGEIGRARDRGELTGELYEGLVVPLVGGGMRASRALLVGAGRRAEF